MLTCIFFPFLFSSPFFSLSSLFFPLFLSLSSLPTPLSLSFPPRLTKKGQEKRAEAVLLHILSLFSSLLPPLSSLSPGSPFTFSFGGEGGEGLKGGFTVGKEWRKEVMCCLWKVFGDLYVGVVKVVGCGGVGGVGVEKFLKGGRDCYQSAISWFDFFF